MKINKHIAALILGGFPVLSFAQVAHDARSILETAFRFVNGTMIPITITLALVYALYTGVEFVRSAGDSAENDEKKQQLIWAIIGLFVIISVWGLVAFVSNSLGIYVGGSLEAR